LTLPSVAVLPGLKCEYGVDTFGEETLFRNKGDIAVFLGDTVESSIVWSTDGESEGDSAVLFHCTGLLGGVIRKLTECF